MSCRWLKCRWGEGHAHNLASCEIKHCRAPILRAYGGMDRWSEIIHIKGFIVVPTGQTGRAHLHHQRKQGRIARVRHNALHKRRPQQLRGGSADPACRAFPPPQYRGKHSLLGGQARCHQVDAGEQGVLVQATGPQQLHRGGSDSQCAASLAEVPKKKLSNQRQEGGIT